MKKNLLFFCILLCTELFANLPKQKLEPFVVGTTSGYAPYVSLNEKGEYEGFDIDVANLLVKKLDRELVLKDLGSMPGLMIGLKQGKVDALIWAISITEERMKNMEMVYYQGEKVLEMPFIFWEKVPSYITSIEDFTKETQKMICVEVGTYQEDVLRKFPNLSLKFLDKITDVLLDVKYGKSWGAAVDFSLLPRIKASYPDIKVLTLPLPLTEQSLGNGICLSKSNKSLADQVQVAIKELIEEGKIRELERKWNLVEVKDE
ncbi:MAG: transporter substrate-binding domain-containing protein [Verrucomicrobia bacterium]|nr:transporter substrate-binding domain-containing protein [Verrucomicrobiota bacterium]